VAKESGTAVRKTKAVARKSTKKASSADAEAAPVAKKRAKRVARSNDDKPSES